MPIKVLPQGYKSGRSYRKDPTKNEKQVYYSNAKLYGELTANAAQSFYNKDLEESIKSKDFSKYNKHLKNIRGENEKENLNRSLAAIQILLNRIDGISTELQNYDPENSIHKDISDDIDTMSDTLKEMFNEILSLRPRLGDLTKDEERRYKTIDDDIDRYSFEIGKVENLLKKLVSGNEKLTQEELNELDKRRKVAKKQSEIKDTLHSIKKYGFDKNSKDVMELSKFLDEDGARDAISKLLEKEIKKAGEVIKELDENIQKVYNVLVNDPNYDSDVVGKNTGHKKTLFTSFKNSFFKHRNDFMAFIKSFEGYVKKISSGKFDEYTIEGFYDDIIRSIDKLVKNHKIILKDFEKFPKAIIEKMGKGTLEKINDITKMLDALHPLMLNIFGLKNYVSTYLDDNKNRLTKLLIENLEDIELYETYPNTDELIIKKGAKVLDYLKRVDDYFNSELKIFSKILDNNKKQYSQKNYEKLFNEHSGKGEVIANFNKSVEEDYKKLLDIYNNREILEEAYEEFNEDANIVIDAHKKRVEKPKKPKKK